MKSHYVDVKIKSQKRIDIIKGQLDGLANMIDADEYCMDLLNQSLAIQNSLKSLDSVLFERHLRTHVAEMFKKNPDQAVTELVTLLRE